MKHTFTIQVLAGFCNVLKSFITALSIGPTNIECRKYFHVPADYSEILDDEYILHNEDERGETYASCRLLILKDEADEQKHLENEFTKTEQLIDIPNTNIHHYFCPTKTIDWYFDRSLISDKVFNRITSTIDRIKWHPKVLSEVELLESQLIHPALSINVRTWSWKYDPPNLTIRTDEPCRRRYDFETYKKAIDTFLPECKTIFLNVDNEDVFPEYLELLKNHKVIFCKKRDDITDLQVSAVNMLMSSKCDYLVCSRLSTFAECIWWFSHCKQKVIALF